MAKNISEAINYHAASFFPKFLLREGLFSKFLVGVNFSCYLMLVLLFAACMILKRSSVLLVTTNVIATSSLIPHF